MGSYCFFFCTSFCSKFYNELTRKTFFFLEQKLLADIISTVEFDQTGDYLATGDKGGRVVLFERNESVKYIYKCYRVKCSYYA